MSLFSKIILLAPGGYMTYYGDWENAITYFTSLGYDCPLRKNPADWFLDLLTLADSASEDNADGTNDYQVSVKRIKHLTESYAKYDASLSKLGQGSRPSLKQQESASTANDLEAAAATAAVESISNDNKILSSIEVTASSSPLTKRPLSKKNASSLSDIDTGFANSWIVEFGILFGRSFTDLCRNATYWKASVFRVVILCIIMGFAYFRMGLDQFGIQDRAGVLYFWPVVRIEE